jgi:hypothetical protein
VTDTASAPNSLLIDLRVGGVSQFSVTKTGVINAGTLALSGISGLGTNVATALAVNVGSAGAFVVNGGALGTPSSGTLTNATGLPVSTGISGLAAGVATFLATPTSANLATAVTDETGTGALVFATSPTLVTPNIGAATGTSLALTPAANTAAINVNGISVTGSSGTNSLIVAGTWDTSGTPSLILGNLTDTNSDPGSLLIDMRVGTVPQFTVRKDGAVFAAKVDLSATSAADSIGTRGVPQNSQSAAYTLVLADAGRHILHPSADTTARTFTIPANGTVAFPVGTVVTFINQNGAGVVTIAITTDTMRLAGAGTTGSRTLAANGIATAIKLTSTEWLISGTGLT